MHAGYMNTDDGLQCTKMGFTFFLSYLSFVHVFVNCVHLFGISLNLELFFFESKLFGVLIHF